MSKTYIPLYRKYRPQTFADLIGQENITTALSNAINLNKVAHAYLFCGPRGTGKTSSARIFAKSLNCINGPTVEPCGTCPSCIDITNSTPVDVVEIDAASNRSVEDAQNILEKIQYVPIHGKFKIYIIDEVHMLSATAFNALLKTLEEPPENVVFILATTEAHKVLETIVSRCQRFDFRRITVDDIVARLEFISKQEKINISKDALSVIAKSAQGGMRDALALLDQLSILDTKKQIGVEDVENLLGKISVNVLYDLTEKILSNSAQEAILEINKIYSKGNEPLRIVSNMIEYFRNLLIIKTCQDEETILTLTQLCGDYVQKLKLQADKMDVAVINYAIDRLAQYLREIKNANDRYLWLEVCVIELANKLSAVGFAELVQRIESLEKTISGGVQCAAPRQMPNVNRAATVPVVNKPAPPVMKPIPDAVSGIIQEVPAKTVEEASVDVEIEEKIEVLEDQSGDDTVNDAVVEQVCENGDVGGWEILLSNFASLPSKMFFSNLSTPVLISKDKVVIAFTKDVFVRQSKEAGRMTPLKAALEATFGTSDMPIDIRLISEEEAADIKSGLSKKKSNVAPTVSQSNNSNVEPSKVKEKETSEDEEFYENQLAQKVETKPVHQKDYSDQAKMIIDLFNGKYMD